MPDLAPYDITSDGMAFIPKVVKDKTFRREGALYGRSSGLYWAVINPKIHPLYVWQETQNDTRSYAKTPLSFAAAVFSNGPMMARFSKTQTVKEIAKYAISGAIVGAIAGAIVGFQFGGFKGLLFGVVVGGVVGTVIGVFAGRARVLSDWVPYNVVLGARHQVSNPGKGFNGTLAFFGRSGKAFSDYNIAPGVPALNSYKELIAGLIPLLLDYKPRSTKEDAQEFNAHYERLATRAGMAAWGLVPFNLDDEAGGEDDNVEPATSEIGNVKLNKSHFSEIDLKMPDDTESLNGVIVMIGNSGALFNPKAAGILASIGTRDAVAMDGSDSVMMGAMTEHFLREPSGNKQLIQRYGFYCD